MDESGKRAEVVRLCIDFAMVLVGVVFATLALLGISVSVLTPYHLMVVATFAIALGVGLLLGWDNSRGAPMPGRRPAGPSSFVSSRGAEMRGLSVAGYQKRYIAKVDRLVEGVLGVEGSSSEVKVAAARGVLGAVQEELQGARSGRGSVNFPAGDLGGGCREVLDSVEVRVRELLDLVSQEGVGADDVLESLEGRLNLSADRYRGPQA